MQRSTWVLLPLLVALAVGDLTLEEYEELELENPQEVF